MTDITATEQDAAPVNARADVIGYYLGTDDNPALGEPKLGAEMEQTFFAVQTLEPLSIEDNDALVRDGRASGLDIHREPSSTLAEFITAPYAPRDLADLLAEMDRRFMDIDGLAAAHGASPSPFGHLPHVPESAHRIVRVPRYKAFWDPPRDDMREACRSFLYPNIQTSVSYHDWDHLLRMTRLCTALEPVLYLLTDASAGFFEGEKIDHCPWMRLKLGRGPNGGVPDFYYTARSGREFIDAHIDFTLHEPYAFVYFDWDGDLQRLESGRYESFFHLETLKLGPRNFLNYRQVQSESWRRVCNIATINDASGGIIGHRAEFNLFNTGLQHQRGTALLIANLIAFDEAFYEGAAALLKKFGIVLENLDGCRNVLDGNFQSFYRHGNKFHGLPFGTGVLRDFALPFADLIEGAYDGTEFTSHIAPALHILRSGRPDWLVFRERFPTLESLKAYLAVFPALARDNPDLLSAESCADLIPSALMKSAAA